MRLAAPFEQFNSLIPHEKIDEFNIKFTMKSDWDNLNKFAGELFPHKRINVEFDDGIEIDDIIKCSKDNKNIYVRATIQQVPFLPTLKEKGVKFFLDSTLPIQSYCLLEWALETGATDIYIAEDLFYNLDNVYSKCQEKNVKIRMILNRLPHISVVSATLPTVQAFSPRDYELLDNYIETAEFDCGDKYDWVKAEVLYRKWFIEHDWNDDARYLNEDIVLPYPVQSIPPELTKFRISCQRRCMTSAINHCGKCKRFLLQSYRNKDNNLVYRHGTTESLPDIDTLGDMLINK